MADPDLVMVLAASYDSVSDAEVDYEAIKALYYDRAASHDFDAAVIERSDRGRVRMITKHEQPTCHGAARGLRVGLAAGAVAALFPAVGIMGALASGGAAGATMGAVAGHVCGGMKRRDLTEIGQLLDRGRAGLIVVYAAEVGDQILDNVRSAHRVIAKTTAMAGDALARELKKQQPAMA